MCTSALKGIGPFKDMNEMRQPSGLKKYLDSKLQNGSGTRMTGNEFLEQNKEMLKRFEAAPAQ